jgi:CRP/FNR family transcriptional regulator, transcriptional activator FtrB
MSASSLDRHDPSPATPDRPDPGLLRGVPMFEQLDDQVLARLGTVTEHACVGAGTELCREGDTARSLHILLDGLITLSAEAPNGRKAVVEVIRPTRHVVLATVLAKLPYAVTAEAIAASRLLVIDAAGLHTLLREDAALADGLMRGQALDFRAMVRQVCDLKLQTAAQRLGCYLLELSQQQHFARGGQFRLPIGKQLLAAQLGCRPENISRAFTSLSKLGVETRGKLVILHDIPRLREFAFAAGPLPA